MICDSKIHLICSRCKVEKSATDFHKSSQRKTGRQSYCKACEAVVKLRRYHEKVKSDQSAKEKKAEYDRMRRDLNREKITAYDKIRNGSDHRRALKRGRVRARKAGIGFATPKWLSSDHRQAMKAIYRLSAKWQKTFGMEYHVDHIVPLRGKNVCGLHVPWNLQILEKSLNKAKSNQLNRKQFP